MLERLSVENFTVFSKASFEFAAGLNVIVGENGTGKSHVLKLAYAVLAESNKQNKNHMDMEYDSKLNNPMIREYSGKLINIFRIKSINQLLNFKSIKKNSTLRISLDFHHSPFRFDLEYKVLNKQNGQFRSGISPLSDWQTATTVFLPTRELLTIYPGFVSLYEGRYLEFDETYYDTCLLLGDPPLRKPMTGLLSVLEDAMGGKVILDSGRFYLVTPDQGKIEMPLVAEGLRKLAMLAQLIAVGALQKGGYLFWDEPEANLNPRLVKVVARVILQLAKAGIQIFIATHSLFLLREFEVLQTAEKKPVPQRYFALKQGADGVEVEQGNAIDDLKTLVLLDEELLQSDRYMALES